MYYYRRLAGKRDEHTMLQHALTQILNKLERNGLATKLGCYLKSEGRFRDAAKMAIGLCLSCATLTHAAEFIPLGIYGGPCPTCSSSSSRVLGMSDDGANLFGTTTTDLSNRPFRWTRGTGMDLLIPDIADDDLGGNLVFSTDGSTIAWSKGRESRPVGDPLGAVTTVLSEEHGLTTIPGLRLILMSGDGSLLTGRSYDLGTTVWTRDRGLEALPLAERGLSDDGSTVSGDYDRMPVRWKNGELEFLGKVDGDNNHHTLGTSADGSVIYGLSESVNAPSFHINDGGPNTLWKWTEETGIVVLATGLADSDFFASLTANGPTARGNVSADGRVVSGGAGESIFDTGYRDVFRWTEDGGVQVLGLDRVYPAYTSAAHAGMTRDGTWLFGSVYDLGISSRRSWLWSETTGVLDLLDLLNLQGNGSAIEGWSDLRASHISDNGRVLAGQGLNPEGNAEAWVVYLDPIVVPEPTALVLANLALAGILSMRRHRYTTSA